MHNETNSDGVDNGSMVKSSNLENFDTITIAVLALLGCFFLGILLCLCRQFQLAVNASARRVSPQPSATINMNMTVAWVVPPEAPAVTSEPEDMTTPSAPELPQNDMNVILVIQPDQSITIGQPD